MDFKMFRAIYLLAGRSLILDKFMILISNRIRYVYIFLLTIMWFKKDIYRKITINSVISLFITLIIHFLTKLFYYKPRPFMKRRVGILIPSKTDSSFLSKHTLFVFAISTSLFFYQRLLGSIMYGLSFLTGLSRIWVGHHYPSDIIRSAIIGSITSMITEKLSCFRKFFNRDEYIKLE